MASSLFYGRLDRALWKSQTERSDAALESRQSACTRRHDSVEEFCGGDCQGSVAAVVNDRKYSGIPRQAVRCLDIDQIWARS